MFLILVLCRCKIGQSFLMKFHKKIDETDVKVSTDVMTFGSNCSFSPSLG